MGRKNRQSRRRTPWDGNDDLTPVQQYIRTQYLARYEERHPTLKESNEAELINSYVPAVCPFCGASDFMRYGTDSNGIQRYKCGVCGQRFRPTTGTIFDSRKIPISEWIEYCLNIIRYVSLNADSMNNRNAFSTGE